jgi:hypothetical protein
VKLNKFIPLTKMEEQSDGSLHVFGTVTAELPDLDMEVCDYVTTKAFYEKRTAENLQKTSIEGMKPSIMPFRQMHQLVTQGAGRTIVFDDAAKTIKMGFDVVDSNAVKMWKAGCFVGFSQGGAYVKQWPDPEHDGCVRYTADPLEVSAVDSPCLPSALVESMKGKTVQLQKADGVTEEIQLEIKSLDTSLLVKMDRFLDLISKLESVRAQIPAQNERHDTIPIGKGVFSMKITDQAGLTKAAKTIHDHLERLEEMHKAHGEHMKKAHEAMEAKHEQLGEHIEKCMKAAKDSMDGEEPEKAAPSGDLAKTNAQIEALAKTVSELTEKLSKMPAKEPPHTGAEGVVKTAPTGFEDLLPASTVTR